MKFCSFRTIYQAYGLDEGPVINDVVLRVLWRLPGRRLYIFPPPGVMLCRQKDC